MLLPLLMNLGMFAETSAPATRPSGGIPAREFSDVVDRRFGRRKRAALADEVVEIIAQVAERQIEDLHLDEVQRTEELLRELQAKRLEFDARHLTALNEIRDELMNREIGRLLRAKMKRDEEDAIIDLLIAATQLT